jgi:hypothetical protein
MKNLESFYKKHDIKKDYNLSVLPLFDYPMRHPVSSDHIETWGQKSGYTKWDLMVSPKAPAILGNWVAAHVQTGVRINENYVKKATAFIKDLTPPPYPFSINKKLATKGELLYKTHCAACHDSQKTFRPQDIGIYTTRMAAVDDEFVSYLKSYVDSIDFPININKASDFIYPEGGPMVTARNLQGLWLRAPYFHNGSVPSIRHLLVPELKRSLKGFYRGNAQIDEKNLGFIWDKKIDPEALWQPTSPAEVYGNNWHEGEFLRSDGGKWEGQELESLIEYLKTL